MNFVTGVYPIIPATFIGNETLGRSLLLTRRMKPKLGKAQADSFEASVLTQFCAPKHSSICLAFWDSHMIECLLWLLGRT